MPDFQLISLHFPYYLNSTVEKIDISDHAMAEFKMNLFVSFASNERPGNLTLGQTQLIINTVVSQLKANEP